SRPEVDGVGGDFRIGVVELSDLTRLGAIQATGNREFAPLDEDFGIVESGAAGDEAALAGVAATRSRAGVEFMREDFETGRCLARFDADDFTAPANALARMRFA